MKLEKVTVRINMKAGLEIEKTVPTWEANLLSAIHGEDNVQETGRELVDGEFDPKTEWEFLVRKYGTATNEEGKAYVRLVYPDARSLGSYFDRTAPRQRQQRSAEQVAA